MLIISSQAMHEDGKAKAEPCRQKYGREQGAAALVDACMRKAIDATAQLNAITAAMMEWRVRNSRAEGVRVATGKPSSCMDNTNSCPDAQPPSRVGPRPAANTHAQ